MTASQWLNVLLTKIGHNINPISEKVGMLCKCKEFILFIYF